MSINCVTRADGDVLDVGNGRIRILEDGSRTAGRLGIAEIWLAPGFGGPPQHIHRKHEETFYILSGTVDFTSGTDTVRAVPGSLVTVPIGTLHAFANPDPDQDATLYFTSTPDLYINYFRDLARLKPGPEGLSADAIAEIMTRYATETYHP